MLQSCSKYTCTFNKWRNFSLSLYFMPMIPKGHVNDILTPRSSVKLHSNQRFTCFHFIALYSSCGRPTSTGLRLAFRILEITGFLCPFPGFPGQDTDILAPGVLTPGVLGSGRYIPRAFFTTDVSTHRAFWVRARTLWFRAF